ncbi:MAG: protein-L-isoaspartate(D-aspartate) O-methyltransferase [Planctomycetes bacterium]|nr:protein-L-isoaspartate(D-aspartate) O-methyltransferase [Planctomycetota bacterium]
MTDSSEPARSQMIELQLRQRGITSPEVLEAISRVPRERFVSAGLAECAYSDRALPIECEQTISQPYIVGLMTQSLELTGQETVLEIGTGSGYQTAVLAHLARRVISIERHSELSRQAAVVLDELGLENITLVVDDGSLGHPPLAPYDRIIVTAAAAKPPPALLDQLCEGGLIVIPVGPLEQQQIHTIRKSRGRLIVADLGPCRFVPLVGAQAWPK